MTNEEVYQRAYDEIKLRGLSPHTVEGYLGELRIFLRYFDNRPIDSMGEEEIREFLLYLLDSWKSSGTVNIYNGEYLQQCPPFHLRCCFRQKTELSKDPQATT